jgi:hypothetical protein
MGTGMDTTLMAVPTLDFSSGHLLFLYPLLRQFDTTITELILLMIIMIITNRVIEFGFRDTGSAEKRVTVGKESGYLAIGNGGRIKKQI